MTKNPLDRNPLALLMDAYTIVAAYYNGAVRSQPPAVIEAWWREQRQMIEDRAKVMREKR